MLFNSYEFILLFLPIMFFGYFYLTANRLIVGSKVWLICGSLFFYSYWHPIYLPLILMSILVNYGIGSGFHKRKNKKPILATGILFNLGLLAYFKYTDFFLENFNTIFDAGVPLPHIVLPLAISFFTFQQIAYLVDSYRGETREYDFLNYMLFVSFFPQLIAGPIVHHAEMMPQFSKTRNFLINYRNIALGIFIFSLGLFKKVVIADKLAEQAHFGFDVAGDLSFFEAWLTSLSYTFQLYFDFSGYTDMAIGAALLFNIKLPFNFNSPYKAVNIQDFWRRWHMTLSRFLRDYLYIPLGGNRVGQYRNYLNLFVVFLLGGLWHGASWMFVIWGALHGIGMVLHRIWQELGMKMNRYLAWFLTFNFINITWVFFRAENLDSAKKVLGGMFLPIFNGQLLQNGMGIHVTEVIRMLLNPREYLFWVVVCFGLIFLKNSNQIIQNLKPTYWHILFLLVISFYSLSSLTQFTEFLYFNF